MSNRSGFNESIDDIADFEESNGVKNYAIRDLMKNGVSSVDSDSSHALRDTDSPIQDYSLSCTGGKCLYCGLLLATYDKENDHWVPLEDLDGGIVGDHLYPVCNAGPYMIGNIVYCCRDCNSKKGNHDWVTYLSFLHATSDRTFISNLKSHIKWIKGKFINCFINRVPDQIIHLMIRNNGVTEGDCQMIRELDADKNLMSFTSSVQRELVLRSEGNEKEIHGEFWRDAFLGYDIALKKISNRYGDNARKLYRSAVNMFLWLVEVKENYETPDCEVLVPDIAILNHKDNPDPDMAIASAVQEFMRPILLSVKVIVDSVSYDYQNRRQLQSADGSKSSDPASSVYKTYYRSWNLLMKCWLQTLMSKDNRDKDLERLVRNSVLPPNKTGLDRLLSLSSGVDPMSKLNFVASLILDDNCADKIDLTVTHDDEVFTLDLNEWLPKDLAGIKRKYEEEADRINTVGPSGKKNYNILAWGNIKDELFGMMLREGYDLVDDNGNLNRNGFRTVLIEKLKSDCLTRESDDGRLRLPPSSDSGYYSANKWLKSISILSRIVLNEDVSISLMNPVNGAKIAFDDYDRYGSCDGINNTLHSNTISEQTLNDVRDKYEFANKIRLLRIQAVVGDDSLSDQEKLDQIIAIEFGDKAM